MNQAPVKENRVRFSIRTGTVIKVVVVAYTTLGALRVLNKTASDLLGPSAFKRAESIRESAEAWNEALKEKAEGA